MFGRLLPIAGLELLAGDSKPPPMVRPVTLALVPDGGSVRTLKDACLVGGRSLLRHIVG
jgi:hypothetical protein